VLLVHIAQYNLGSISWVLLVLYCPKFSRNHNKVLGEFPDIKSENKNMAWLQRLFGMEKPADAQVNPEPAPAQEAAQEYSGGETASAETVAPERMGLSGEYDQSGLAKRVALAFDENGQFDDVDSVYVAQTGGTVVLKGEAPSQEVINQMVEIARGVSGATDVNVDQVTVA
jgi:osmotically-inducible protein OsmY